jgi:hypothetical protein
MNITISNIVAAVATTALFSVLSACDADAEEPGTARQGSSTVSPSTAIDTKTWTTYTSARYDFKLGHPRGWTEYPALRDWTFDIDARDSLSPAIDAFLSPKGDVRVGVWNVPLDSGTSVHDSMPAIRAWVEDYCVATGNTPCTGIDDRAVELCLEARDCHPGLLVPFKDDVQAFFSGGIYEANAVTVVAVWRGESASSTAPYGGSQRLLEAFLSTMEVRPASAALSERFSDEPIDTSPRDCSAMHGWERGSGCL